MERSLNFDSRSEAVETLTKLFVNGNIKRDMVDEAESKATIIKEELAKLKKAQQEKQRLSDIAQSIPEIQYPKKWNVRKAGQIYRDELDGYIASRDLPELKEYLAGLQNGAYSEDICWEILIKSIIGSCWFG